MNIKRVIGVLTVSLLLYTLHLTPYTSTAFCASKGNPPVAHWRFDEGGGATAYDESANNNDGTLNAGAGGANTAVGQMWTRQGKIGSALECDGTDDYVDCGNINLEYNAITLSAWIKPNNFNSYNEIFDNNNTAAHISTFRTQVTTGKVQFLIRTTGNIDYSMTSASAVPTGAWSFITAVYDGTNLKIYINGVLDGTPVVATGSLISNSVNTKKIGANGGTPTTQNFSGFIDDVRIYNYARTADQIMVDYNAGAAAHLGAGTDPNEGNPPVCYLPLDENTGTTAIDRSGNGNNGTLTNGPTWTQGKYGTALSFDGSNDYVEKISPTGQPTGNSPATISAWIKIDSSGISENKTVAFFGIDSGGATGYGLYVTSAYKVGSAGPTNTGTIVGNTTLQLGTWYHVAAVYNGATNKVYINGIEDGSVNYSSMNFSSGVLRIGAWHNYNSTYTWKGLLDNVKIYNYARTPGQIAYDYNKGKPVAQYKFDEGGGTIAHNEYSQADAGSGCVGWWRMDNTWADSSGYGNNGTAGGGATFSSSAKIGPYAGSFDGVDDYTSINSTSSLSPTEAITIEAWLKVNAYPTTPHEEIVQKSSCYGLKLYDIGGGVYKAIGYRWGGPENHKSITTIQIGQWYHITMTYDRSYHKIYINGVLENSEADTGAISTSGNAIRIGLSENGYKINGLIDDVRIYNYARTAEQIYNDYKTTHGTLVGDTKFVDGKIGKALTFDGTGDYVTIADLGSNDPFDAANITVTAWIKPNGTQTAYANIVDKAHTSTNWTGWTLEYNSAGQYVYFWIANGSSAVGPTSTTILNDNNWHFVAGTYDGTTAKIYVDGKLESSSGLSGSIGVNTGNLAIGRWEYSPGRYFNGLIDDVRIYNYSRTADQVMQDYTAGASRLGAQSAGEKDPWGGNLPVAYWKLDENTGVLAQDASGNGRDGILKNGTSWTQGKYGSGVSFDGTNDYVEITSPYYAFTNQITVEWWVNRSAALWAGQSTDSVDMMSTNVWIMHQNGTAVSWYVNDSGTWRNVSTGSLSAGQWYHVVGVANSSETAVYVNGVKIASTTGIATGMVSNANSQIHIGKDSRYAAGTGRQMSGLADDLKVYNYARTPAQIAWDYNKGKPVGHWKFEEGSGTTAYDNSGNGNTGTITIGAGGAQANVAAAWTNGATGKYGKCMSFDGTDDYVESGAMNTTITEKTLMAWVKLTNLDQQAGGVVGIQRDPAVVDTFDSVVYGEQIARRWMAGSNGFSRTFNSDAGTEETSLGWVHIAITYKANDYKIYRNGVQIGQSTAYGLASFTSDSRIYSGKRHGTLTGPLNAKVDDVRVYNYARTAEQVMQDYNAGVAVRLGD